MSEQPWWLWVAKIVGALTFVAVVIGFFVNKRKVPFYSIVISFIAFLGGVTYGCIIYQKVVNIIIIGLLSFIAPLLIWFLCGGPVFSQGRRQKGKHPEESK